MVSDLRYRNYIRPRMGRSGMSDTWRKKGEAIGEKMREHEKKGDCETCELFGKNKLSKKREAEFRACWGEDSSRIKKKECLVYVDDFYEKCPQEQPIVS